MANNIVLIGMPGSGKTHICRKLAEVLTEYTAIDTDSLIEKISGMKISEIFEKYSEDYFRKLEYDTIKQAANGKNKILSIGGGAFENPDTRSTLLNFGIVFYLKSNLDVLYYRISKESTRPLLQCENPRQALENLLKKREENYQKANYIIDTENLTEDKITEYILGIINETNASC